MLKCRKRPTTGKANPPVLSFSVVLFSVQYHNAGRRYGCLVLELVLHLQAFNHAAQLTWVFPCMHCAGPERMNCR